MLTSFTLIPSLIVMSVIVLAQIKEIFFATEQLASQIKNLKGMHCGVVRKHALS